jgi:AcrR family transcriptional regulator
MGVRDVKRARTRRDLISCAHELFERRGYEKTTVADIAAAAEIGTRTFFSYFASKEELIFAEAQECLEVLYAAIERREPGERPVAVLLRTWESLGTPAELVAQVDTLRQRLIREVPAVRGRALQVWCEAQMEISRRLAAAFPGELDELSAAALTGAFAGALGGVLYMHLQNPGDPAALDAAVRSALAPWLPTPEAQ